MEDDYASSIETGTGGLLASVMEELKRSTKLTPPVITLAERKKIPEQIPEEKNDHESVDQNGIAEYSAYCKITDNPDVAGSAWPKSKPAPRKPKRSKKLPNKNGSNENNSPHIESEIHNLIESAFSVDDKNETQLIFDNFSPRKSSLGNQNRPDHKRLQSLDYHGSMNCIHDSESPRSSKNDRGKSIDYGILHESRSYESLVDSKSVYSAYSDDDSSLDGLEKGEMPDDAKSLSSFNLNEKSERRALKAKARAKHLKHQAAVQKDRVGAFLDAAATNATDRIKKLRRPSMKFRAGKAKLQSLANKLGPGKQSDQNSINYISSPNQHLPNGNCSDNEDSLKTSFGDRFTIPSQGYNSTSKSSRQMAIKSGYLKKQGGKIKTWNERWFILKGDQLHYYKEANGKYLASIFLPGSQVVPYPSRSNDTHKFMFEIIPANEQIKVNNNHESYLLSAPSQADMDEWMKVIKRVILSPFGGGIFGQRLDETLRHDRRLDSPASSTSLRSRSKSRPSPRQVPIIVENCVEFIRANKGLTEEGLFRLPGQANEVKDLQDAYDMGERPIFPKATDVHTVASLLKGYLRELPEPVIPFEQYESLISAAKLSQRGSCDIKQLLEETERTKEQEEARKVIKEQVNMLPQPNFDLLRYLCQFLHEVDQHSASNKMDMSNLSLVFGPNLMKAKEENAHTMMADASYVQRVIFQFIAHHEFFFPKDDDLSHPPLRTLPSVNESPDGMNINGDAGIGTLTTTASNNNTLTLRNAADDSGTGSLDATPENTQKRAPPVPSMPPPLRKPLKPTRRRQSAQSSAGSDASALPLHSEPQRKSFYDNVTTSSGGKDPETCSNSSVHAIAGSVDGLDSPRSSSLTGDCLRLNSCASNSSLNEANRVLDPSQEKFQTSSAHHSRTSSCPTSKSAAHLQRIGDSLKSDRLSIGSTSDESSALTLPSVPTKPSRFPRRGDDNQSSSSQRSSKTDFDPLDPNSTSPSFRRSHANSDAGNSFTSRPPSYKELQDQVQALKDEIEKQRLEHEKRSRMLEEHYVMKMRSNMQSLGDVPSSPTDYNSFLSDDSAPENCDAATGNSARSGKLSTESQSESKYREEAKRHAMTKIRLRNAERGLKQAEERNMQLQKEMEQFFETFGSMLNQPPS